MKDRLEGVLLGTALGDALGIAAEGMSAAAIARRFGPPDRIVTRFHLLGQTGFVSDDTEQAALVAQSLARHPDDPDACALAFRRALIGWFCRLPWGVGLATLKACLRIAAGLPRSGVRSAGNGAAMRAPVVGVFLHDRPKQRERFGRALAEVTHTDPRAVEGALFAAEVAAACARSAAAPGSLQACCLVARASVAQPELASALDRAADLAADAAETGKAAGAMGTSGFVVQSLAFATFCFARYGDEPARAIGEAISGGGDTDTNAALVGAWVGALHGARGLPEALIRRLHDGPFGPTHLATLAQCLAAQMRGDTVAPPGYSLLAALLRNLALYPVVLAHGVRRIMPW